MVKGHVSGDVSTTPSRSLQEQYTLLRQIQQQILLAYRPLLQQGVAPIRIMARLVADLERQCREHGVTEEVLESKIANRTIGDIDLRRVTECEGEPRGAGDYRMLAEELGVALPNENIHGYVAPGETYCWLLEQMQECERLLLAQKFDLRIYDLQGAGNPILRSWLAEEMQQWGIHVASSQVLLGLGSLDSIDKTLRGLRQMHWGQDNSDIAILFPAPGFNVPEWQAKSYGYRHHRVHTRAENHFKLTASQLEQALQQDPAIRIVYLTIANNPTAFAYSPEELEAIHTILRNYWAAGREIIILADLAYVGTGKSAEDAARMATFTTPDVLQHSILASSFSKTYTLTGERFGWVTIGNAALATDIVGAWANSMATLPAEWQLRFMAYIRLLRTRPWLLKKLRGLYRLRRTRLIAQLQRIDEEMHLFAHINMDDDTTVYNWSQLLPGEDTFSLFEKTGIAGVPGSAFGYSDDYVRFSIGVIPVPVI